jgi:Cys-tRNA(Pro)/Cys-tRNA(Cys) deacylase
MTAATDDLDQRHIPYRLFRHAGKVESLEQAAAERGQQPEQVVRTIVFRLSEGEFALALMAGPRQVSWAALRRTLGQRRLTMASPDEVKAATGYVPGTVSPFGLPAPRRILVDRSVLASAEISLGSGERGLAIMMTSADLLTALGESVEVGEWGENS